MSVAAFSLGVGADAEIVAAAEAEPFRKRGFGALHYAATSVRVVARHLAHRSPDIEVSSGALSSPAIGAMAQFRNSYTFLAPSTITYNYVSITKRVIEEYLSMTRGKIEDRHGWLSYVPAAVAAAAT